MRWFLSLSRIAILAAVASQSCGCIAFYTQKQVRLRVVNRETGQPIAGAEVECFYPKWFTINAPKSNVYRTDAVGAVEARIATYDGVCFISASGYLKHHPVPTKSLVQNGSTLTQIALYCEPAPTITIVVPNGFHGLLKCRTDFIEGTIQGDAPGQRKFTFTASSSGDVWIQATALLDDVSSQWRVIYENGCEATSSWWINSSHGVVTYIGSREEALDFYSKFSNLRPELREKLSADYFDHPTTRPSRGVPR